MSHHVLYDQMLTRKLSSPGIFNQHEEIGAIDGHLPVKHNKTKLVPHNVGDIQSRLPALLLDEHQQQIHEIRMYLILVLNAREQSVAKDMVHDIQKGDELSVAHPLGSPHLSGVVNQLGLVNRCSVRMRPEANRVIQSSISISQRVHEGLPVGLQQPSTSHPNHAPLHQHESARWHRTKPQSHSQNPC